MTLLNGTTATSRSQRRNLLKPTQARLKNRRTRLKIPKPKNLPPLIIKRRLLPSTSPLTVRAIRRPALTSPRNKVIRRQLAMKRRLKRSLSMRRSRTISHPSVLTLPTRPRRSTTLPSQRSLAHPRRVKLRTTRPNKHRKRRPALLRSPQRT